MGLTKITFIERARLLAMYAAGFEKEAQDYALELGCSKYYATILHERMAKKLYCQKEYNTLSKWHRAVAIGKIEI